MGLSIRNIHDETTILGGNEDFKKMYESSMMLHEGANYATLEEGTLLRLALQNFAFLVPRGVPITFAEWADNIRSFNKSPQAAEVANMLDTLFKKYGS